MLRAVPEVKGVEIYSPKGGRLVDYRGCRVNVYLVEPHESLRKALSELLDAQRGIRIVGGCGTAASAVREIERCAPHVAVIGDGLPDGDELSLCWTLAQVVPRLRVIFHPALLDRAEACLSELIGVSACVTKGVRLGPLVEALRLASCELVMIEHGSQDLWVSYVRGVRSRTQVITAENRRLREEAQQRVDVLKQQEIVYWKGVAGGSSVRHP